MTRYLHGPLLVVAGIITCMVSGCQAQRHSDRPSEGAKPAVVEASHSPEGSGVIPACQRDLDSLKQVNTKVWAVRKADFDALVSGVSVYASVRGNVNGKTRETLDSLYRYKTNQICAQIERDVLEGLISRGESIR
ncbi:Uncharacterised protein [Serratia fonticola]|jgi:hypothetical protein|uniref:hypothetical protein n=1 Tax=Serratia fonticola TaxID=47917 RepID=UPI0021777544|nr:hypothetical protein [Serratia fonticola]CAI1746801.1 Uncharacterised protein [Serratia fonticola]